VPGSDWDLLVVVPDDLAPPGFDDPMTVWRVKQGTGVRADVLLCRASEFEEDRHTHNTIAYDAAIEGVPIAVRYDDSAHGGDPAIRRELSELWLGLGPPGRPR
jgi:hypothetical protein